jgi:hypothetical protein
MIRRAASPIKLEQNQCLYLCGSGGDATIQIEALSPDERNKVAKASVVVHTKPLSISGLPKGQIDSAEAKTLTVKITDLVAKNCWVEWFVSVSNHMEFEEEDPQYTDESITSRVKIPAKFQGSGTFRIVDRIYSSVLFERELQIAPQTNQGLDQGR